MPRMHEYWKPKMGEIVEFRICFESRSLRSSLREMIFTWAILILSIIPI